MWIKFAATLWIRIHRTAAFCKKYGSRPPISDFNISNIHHRSFKLTRYFTIANVRDTLLFHPGINPGLRIIEFMGWQLRNPALLTILASISTDIVILLRFLRIWIYTKDNLSCPFLMLYIQIFGSSESNTSQSMISCSFINIGSHLSDIWPFYGQKWPRKSSFSLYNV